MNALEGLKVVDFGSHIVAPFLTQYLAQHGATVVKVESMTRVDGARTAQPYKDGLPGINRGLIFASVNSSKLSIALNLKHGSARSVVERLIGWCDVAVENFAPGVMERLGLGYAELAAIKPDIIMLRSTMQGQTGPHARQPGLGTVMAVLPGFAHLLGWPDRDPLNPYGAYTDFPAPRLGVAVLLAAIDYRRRTGLGQCLDLSQLECSLQFLAPAILDYVVNGCVAGRTGNQCPEAAPHGVYRCRGDDCWCAITVFTDEEWAGLLRAMGRADLAADPRFAGIEVRKRHEHALDALVEAWTAGLTAEEVMVTLQTEGVPAGIVHSAEGVWNDPQLAYRQHFVAVNHPEVGTVTAHTGGFRLSKTPAEINPYPSLGEHTEYVCTELLRMSTEEFVALDSQGVFE